MARPELLSIYATSIAPRNEAREFPLRRDRASGGRVGARHARRVAVLGRFSGSGYQPHSRLSGEQLYHFAGRDGFAIEKALGLLRAVRE